MITRQRVALVFTIMACMPGLSRLQRLTAEETHLYVAPNGNDSASGRSIDQPLQTLSKARDVIRQLRRVGQLDGSVRVHLRGGRYTIAKPLVLTAEDSGRPGHPVVWTAWEDEQPTVSGGRTISGWTRHTDKIWKTSLPDVTAGDWNFRQLFVNGQLRHRARIPNDGFLRVAGFPEGTPKTVHYHTDCKSFEYAAGDIDPTWKNLDDVEVIVYHFWTDSHLPIESIDEDQRIVTFAHRAGKVFTDDFTTEGARYIIENVYEGLDIAGEWYLDRAKGTLYYIPMPDEDLTTAEVVAPVAPCLIRFDGEPLQRQFVEHIEFSNIRFQYTHFQLPVGNSNDRQGSASVPAAVVMQGTRHCRFRQCDFENLGTFAFELNDGCVGNQFLHNRLAHLGAGGFRIDGGTQKDHPLTRTLKNTISDNDIGPYGEEYPSAVGVLLMNTASNLVAHNHIHHGGYTGISVGWVWGYGRSISRDNIVLKNHIHHIGQGLLSDMGGIYTLGVSPGTVLKGNHIHHVEANHYGGWGIYNDEGSSHILIENNVVHDTKFAAYNIHYAKEVTVRNNIFACGRLQQLSRSRVEPHKSVFFENNIVYWTEGKLLDNKWDDQDYEFYLHPKGDRGTVKQTHTFEMDYNVYFNPNLAQEQIDMNGLTWSQWQQRGLDNHSIYTDPLFVDPRRRDFRLQANSPAFELGFQPIDISDAGPRSGDSGKSRP